jgi:hypothetical protein
MPAPAGIAARHILASHLTTPRSFPDLAENFPDAPI